MELGWGKRGGGRGRGRMERGGEGYDGGGGESLWRVGGWMCGGGTAEGGWERGERGEERGEERGVRACVLGFFEGWGGGFLWEMVRRDFTCRFLFGFLFKAVLLLCMYRTSLLS